MVCTLVLGRDLNATGTASGPEVEPLLVAAVRHQQLTGAILVVAAGFSPDFPSQPKSYGEMLADRLRELGATKLVVLRADHFSSFGELTAFHHYCLVLGVDEYEILGFDWHLKRVLCEARQVDREWAKKLKPVPIPGKMKTFDRFIEPLKWAKLVLPRRWQVQAIELWKRYVSKRTSY